MHFEPVTFEEAQSIKSRTDQAYSREWRTEFPASTQLVTVVGFASSYYYKPSFSGSPLTKEAPPMFRAMYIYTAATSQQA